MLEEKQTNKLKFKVGDVTKPVAEDKTFVIHIVNNHGVMGAGVAKALAEKWSKVKNCYLVWSLPAKDIEDVALPFELGQNQYVKVEDNVVVVNMVAQDGFPTREKPRATDYDALRKCLTKIAEKALVYKSKVILPAIGIGLGGAEPEEILKIVQECLINKDIDTTMYLLTMDEKKNISKLYKEI